MKGFFKPNHPEKYAGDPKNIVFRSSYEFKFFRYLDSNPNIIQWASEEMHLSYMSPKDGKFHRYYPDNIFKTKDGKVFMIEIKPFKETLPPKVSKTKKGERRYLTEVMTYGINQSKWAAAKNYCRERGWEFKILTEKELF